MPLSLSLQAGRLRVRISGPRGSEILDIRDLLPGDAGPIVVAGARVGTYRVMTDRRVGIEAPGYAILRIDQPRAARQFEVHASQTAMDQRQSK